MRRSTSAAATPPASPSPSPAPPAQTSPQPGTTKRQRKAVPLGDVTNLILRPETPTPIKPRKTARRPLPAPSDASAVSSTCSSSVSASASVTPALKPSSSASATPTPEPSSSAAPATPAPQPSSSATTTPAPRPPSTASAAPAPELSSAAATVTPAPVPSSAATVTPAPKPSFATVLEEEGSIYESPTICTVYARRRTTEAEVEVRRRRNLAITNKGKEPVGAAASCPPPGKSRKNIKKKDTRPISSSAPCREAKNKRRRAGTPKLPEEFVKKQKAYFADVDAFELAEEEVSESELE